MYFEIYKKGELVKRGNEILGDLDWSNELMYVPSTSIDLPITYREFITGREEVKIYVNDKCFFGIVVGIEENKPTESMKVELEHVIREWSYRQISVNNAIKAKTINVIYQEEEGEGDPTVSDQLAHIYSDKNFAYPGWVLNMSDKAKGTKIDYVYSRQHKLDALTKTVELTPDLFWRVRFIQDRVVDIGELGEKKPYIISTKPSGPTNIRIIEEPVIKHEFDKVINLATVYSEKSDSGMSSMTLREVYDNPTLQLPGFPVVILRENVNNERDYTHYVTQYPVLAPNNELEYAVLDEESIAIEGGVVIEGTYAFNDLSPFTVEDENSGSDGTPTVTDEDRVMAATTAYHAAVRKLKEARRYYSISIKTEELPADLSVGDKVRLLYDNSVLIEGACSNYMKKMLSFDDWFYVTKIDYRIGVGGIETNTITLEKILRIEREISEEL